MAEETATFNWNEFLKNSTLQRIPEKVFALLDIETLTICRLVSKEWKDFIDNNLKLNQKQLQFGLKLAKKKDFYRKSTFNSHQYKAIEEMHWNPTDLKIVLQVIKEVCDPPMIVSMTGHVVVSDLTTTLFVLPLEKTILTSSKPWQKPLLILD